MNLVNFFSSIYEEHCSPDNTPKNQKEPYASHKHQFHIHLLTQFHHL